MTLVRNLHLLAMAFFVGGQLLLVAAVVPSLRGDAERARMRTIARRWHMRRPRTHAPRGGIFLGSLAIAWLGVSLAH